MRKRLFLLTALTALTAITAVAMPAHAQTATAAAVAQDHAIQVHAIYEDTLAAARTMQQQVTAFAAQPAPASLDTARQAWLAAREFYGQTEALRFYGGPIDDDKGPEGRINAWPMDESYVDKIIANRKTKLDKKTLSAMNERGGEENIATGWHAIEYLLWGQDKRDDGPGGRGADDFIDGKTPNADRRRQYLAVVTDLLIDDLSFLVRAWAPGVKNNYRARFERGGNESLRKIFVGLGSLSRGELAGERLEVALASRDQEDEHSCFSDNTHRDAVNNALGIENVWLGRFQRADGSVLRGVSLRDLIAAKDAPLAEKTTQQIRASVALAEGIRAPFDREITDAAGRLRIQTVIASLTQQSKDLVASATAIGITRLTLVEPKK
jgi:putative iron-regulated protein